MKAIFIAIVILMSFESFVCFDTGDHFDITEIVLRKFGYSADAIKVVQVTNYLTDVFSQRWFQFTKGINNEIFDSFCLIFLSRICFSLNLIETHPLGINDLNKLHFDGLLNLGQVRFFSFLTHFPFASQTQSQNQEFICYLIFP